MLAPSFPINFKYPAIIGMLRDLGFDKVTEVTFGARMTNYWYAEYIKENPEQKFFIASPCPTITSFIESQYPDLAGYLVPISSPMLSMARIYRKHHPDYKIIFLSPCFAKKAIEAPKHKENIDMVITFQELEELFTEANIKEEDYNRDYYFNSLIREFTKVYPISGGLAETSHIGNLFNKDEVFVADGISNIRPVLEEIKAGGSKYRFLDILNCPGGCIGGPTTNQNLSTDDKKKLIEDYLTFSSEKKMGAHLGTVERVHDVDFKILI